LRYEVPEPITTKEKRGRGGGKRGDRDQWGKTFITGKKTEKVRGKGVPEDFWEKKTIPHPIN